MFIVQLLTPVFMALFPVFAAGTAVLTDVMLQQFYVPAALAAALAMIFFLLSWTILKDTDRAAIVASLLAVAFFCFGGFYSAFAGILIGAHIKLDITLAGVVYSLITLGLAVLIARSSYEWKRIVPMLCAAGFLITVGSAVPIVDHELRTPNAIPAEIFKEPMPVLSKNRSDKRDVYYLVFDAFGSPRTLEVAYQYDQKPFVEELRKRGFRVCEDARSNYDRTALSFCAYLNQGYLDGASNKAGVDNPDLTYLNRLIQSNRLFTWMKENGYRVINIRSSNGATLSMPGVTNVGSVLGNNFLIALMQTTLLNAFDPQTHWLRDMVVQGRENFYTCIPIVEKMPGPKFVFAHTLLSHPPFIFGASGETLPLSPKFLSEDYDKRLYVGQIKYCEKLMLKAIDRLLSQKDKPIIVLQADHGPAISVPHSSNEYLDERLHILNAVYIPDSNYADMPAALSGINMFRYAAREGLHAQCDLLPERSFVAPDDKPYRFEDVSSRIR
jgi:hypothetical protein